MSIPWPPGRAVEPRDPATAVLCAAFDGATDAAVLDVRAQLAASGLRQPDRPRHRPHLTLAAARVAALDVPAVVSVAGDVAAATAPVAVTLSEIGRFGRAGALWLGPDAAGSAALRPLQHEADVALAGRGWPPAFGARSDPQSWVPHCTLATRLAPRRLRELQDRLRDGYVPIVGTVAALAVIVVGGSGDIALLPLTGPLSG